MLLASLNAAVDIAFSESLLGEEIPRQLDFFIQKGFAQRDSGQIKTKLVLNKGLLTANGNAFNPFALMLENPEDL